MFSGRRDMKLGGLRTCEVHRYAQRRREGATLPSSSSRLFCFLISALMPPVHLHSSFFTTLLTFLDYEHQHRLHRPNRWHVFPCHALLSPATLICEHSSLLTHTQWPARSIRDLPRGIALVPYFPTYVGGGHRGSLLIRCGVPRDHSCVRSSLCNQTV